MGSMGTWGRTNWCVDTKGVAGKEGANAVLRRVIWALKRQAERNEHPCRVTPGNTGDQSRRLPGSRPLEDPFLGFQVGYTFGENPGWYWELGLGAPPGASLTYFYISDSEIPWQNIPLPPFWYWVSFLEKIWTFSYCEKLICLILTLKQFCFLDLDYIY